MAARAHTTALFAAEVQSKAEGQSVLCAKERQTRKRGGEEVRIPSGAPFSNLLKSLALPSAKQDKAGQGGAGASAARTALFLRQPANGPTIRRGG